MEPSGRPPRRAKSDNTLVAEKRTFAEKSGADFCNKQLRTFAKNFTARVGASEKSAVPLLKFARFGGGRVSVTCLAPGVRPPFSPEHPE